MFRSLKDVQKTLQEIRKMKDYLDDNVKNPNVRQKPPPELVKEYEKLKLSMALFNEMNQQVFKAMGLEPREMNRQMQRYVPGRDPKVEAVLREADALRCDLILSQAKFIRENYKEYLESNRPFQSVKRTEKSQEIAKKKVKNKFKGMTQRMKWNKM